MLASLVPAPLVRVFARPYLAGGTMRAALDAASVAWDRGGMLSTLDLLGESVTRNEQVDANVEVYRRLMDLVSEDERFAELSVRPSVSLKPSAFTSDNPEHAFSSIRTLVEHAQLRKLAVTIDMEDRSWTDITLDHAVALYEDGFDVGTVLQTRLHRTEQDLERIPAGMRVRLVIGIYPEPEAVALTSKTEMKRRLIPFSARLLERGAKVEFATHDDVYVERFVREVFPLAPERCELQVLLGVPRAGLLKRVRERIPTIPVRVYVPFATDMVQATAYLRRRMNESPNIAWLVLRNLFVRG